MALHYKIALANVWWNDDYKDVRRFSSRSERATYFSLNTIFNNSPEINLDIKNLLQPRIVFRIPNKDVFEVLNADYLIVNNTALEDESSSEKYYFYFIDKIVQDSGDQYIADCKLDVWTTYGFNADIGLGFVERAHLDRFTDDETDLGLNFAPDSPLMIEERTPSNNDKILVSRSKLCIAKHNQSNNFRAGDWFSNNVKGWAYVFIQGDETYKMPKFTDEVGHVTDNDVLFASVSTGDKFFLPYGVMIMPLYKGNKKIYIKAKYYDEVAEVYKDCKVYLDYNLYYFKNANNDYSFIYSQKILPVNPFFKILKSSNLSDDELTYPDSWLTVDNDGELCIEPPTIPLIDPRGQSASRVSLDITYPKMSIVCNAPESSSIKFNSALFSTARDNDISLLIKQYLTIAGSPLDKPFITNHFLASNLKAYIKALFTNHAKRIQRLNPKLYGASYHEFRLNIANQGASSYSYAQLAAYKNQEQNLFVARASIIPEVEVLGLSPYKSFYLTDSIDYQSAFGTIVSSDFSIAFKNDVYEQFLANNKNFWLQNKVNWQKNAFNLLTGSLLSGDYTTKGAGKLLRGGVDISIDMFSTKYQVNNMQNAPDNYSAGSGVVNYQLSFEDGINYYLDEYIVPECIMKRDDDYMHLYGFKVGRLMNFEDVVNIRAYFNFVQGSFEAIRGTKSDEVRRILKDTLLSGVRFWNVDRTPTILERENFENRLVN